MRIFVIFATFAYGNNISLMNIFTDDERLAALIADGYTTDRKLLKLGKDTLKAFLKAVKYLEAAKRIEHLYKMNSLNYERLGGKLKGYESIRCNKKYRIIFKSFAREDETIITNINIIKLSNHYDDL